VRFITHVLHNFSPTVRSIWRQGINFEITENGKTCKVLVQHDFADLEMQAGNVLIGSKYRTAETNELTVEVQCLEGQLVYDVFVSLLESIVTITGEWKCSQYQMLWSDRAICKSMPTEIPITTLEECFQNDQAPPAPRNFIMACTIPDYTGRRVQYNQIQKVKNIGVGGFAQVFLGSIDGEEMVAVKELFFQSKENNYLTKLKFRHKLMLQSSLCHPSIVAIHGAILK
jgi:hypothetical protein